jgi:hypothetical protein
VQSYYRGIVAAQHEEKQTWTSKSGRSSSHEPQFWIHDASSDSKFGEVHTGTTLSFMNHFATEDRNELVSDIYLQK